MKRTTADNNRWQHLYRYADVRPEPQCTITFEPGAVWYDHDGVWTYVPDENDEDDPVNASFDGWVDLGAVEG
jgi:hypothetical protein